MGVKTTAWGAPISGGGVTPECEEAAADYRE